MQTFQKISWLNTLGVLSGILCLIMSLQSCYSLKGISIDPNTNTFYVANFDNTSDNVVPTLGQVLTERLKEKVRSESRLKYNEESPDLEFEGVITEYRVSSQAPQPGETVAFNRLTITVKVTLVNNQNEKAGWTKNFSFFRDFGANENLLNNQDTYINDINEQLVENIFNAAFANW